MSSHDQPDRPPQAGPDAGPRTRHRRIPVLIGTHRCQGAGAVAAGRTGVRRRPSPVRRPRPTVAAQVPAPPTGEAWVQGALTDQAGHRLNNVNVEVWSTDLNATEPVASNLSYAGDPADGRHQSGVYRVAVPSGTPYRLTFSTVSGQEDGDKFRAQAYGAGRPIVTRSQRPSAARDTAVMAKAGRAINLGITQMVRQGTVSSKTTARLSGKKITAGKTREAERPGHQPVRQQRDRQGEGEDRWQEGHRAADRLRPRKEHDQASEADAGPLMRPSCSSRAPTRSRPRRPSRCGSP